jgi:hypothetical protein
MPKILSNTPTGEDYLKTGSHNKIAETIIDIINNDVKLEKDNKLEKKIIGLEGEWGSGKSNIIKIIESRINKDKISFHHFLFDTWTHQEDLNRKSLLDELIKFLKIKTIINENDEKETYLKLYKKEITKNTTSYPIYKIYYILWVTAFLIITLGNLVYKERVNERIFRGFYDDSFKYLVNEFYFNFLFILYPRIDAINFIYLLKISPFVLIIIGFIVFCVNFCSLLNNGKKTIEILSELFSFSRGDSNNKSSIEYIQEVEKNNRAFKSFLKEEIDSKLNGNILIITFDNIDRLTDDKVIAIWSMINIFFAEEIGNNLSNIWLIIPFDESKIIKSFKDEEIAEGLLDKTFSFTFRVTPPITSNWEKNIFEKLFKEAFFDIVIDNDELSLLTRIFAEYNKKINPRKVINFINDLVTYYYLNSEIKMRYVALFNLNKNRILGEGSINENIINREYLSGLKSYFENDDLLDINIAKVVYGVDTDEDANECLLIKDINDVLYNNSVVDISNYISTPSFYSNFTNVFNKFIWSISAESLNVIKISNILLIINSDKINESEKIFIKKCWDNFNNKVFNKPYLIIDLFVKEKNKFPILENKKSLLDNMIFYSTQNKTKVLLNHISDYLFDNTETKDKKPKYSPKTYYEFLSCIRNSLISNSNSNLTIQNLDLKRAIINPDLFLEIFEYDKDIYNLRIDIKNEDLIDYFLNYNLPFDDYSITYERVSKNKELIYDLNFTKKYDFNRLLKFLIEIINNGNLNDVKEFDLYIDVIYNLSEEQLLNININNTFDKYILFLNSENITINTSIYTILLANFHRYYLLTNSDIVVKNNLELLQKFEFNVEKASNRILDFISINEFIKIISILKRIEFENLNILLENALINNDLSELDFAFLVENYSDFKKYVFNNDSSKLLKLFKKKYSKNNIEIERVDLALIGENSVFEEKILFQAKEYLLNNHSKIEKNLLSDTFYLKLLKKLIALEILNDSYFNNDFYVSLKDLLIKINFNDIKYNILFDFKRNLEKLKLIDVFKDVLLKRNLNNSNVKLIKYMSPEINELIIDPQLAKKKQIIERLSKRKS